MEDICFVEEKTLELSIYFVVVVAIWEFWVGYDNEHEMAALLN